MTAVRGRTEECRRLREFAGGLRDGLGGALVLSGDPGVGRTTLLEYAAAAARPLPVLRVAGVAAEADFPFAALHRLLIPVLSPPRLDALPPAERHALRVACGLSEGTPVDPHLAGRATRTLLTHPATAPVLCCIDDTQWLDGESLEALAHIAYHDPPLGLLFTVPTPNRAAAGPGLGPAAARALAGLPALEIAGLSEADGVALLRSVVTGPLDQRVAARLVTATGGNPLALRDLGRELTAGQLTGVRTLPDPVPVGSRLAEHHLRHLRRLPEPTQLWLLLAAAEPRGDLAVISAAAARLGVTPAGAGHLLIGGPVVTFQEQPVRSAVYSGATGLQRRTVHAALAEVTTDADLRAWHRAAACVGTDEPTAAELARTADQAAARGGYPARVAYLTRAAELTPEGPDRSERLLAAADAALTAGAPLQALAAAEAALSAGVRLAAAEAPFGAGVRLAAAEAPFGAGVRLAAAEAPFGAGVRLAAAEVAFSAGVPVAAPSAGVPLAAPSAGVPLAAAEAAAGAGAPHAPAERALSGRALIVRAKALVMLGGAEAYAKGSARCLASARAFADSDPRLARDALLEAAEHAIRAGHLIHGTSPAEIAATAANWSAARLTAEPSANVRNGTDDSGSALPELLLETFTALASGGAEGGAEGGVEGGVEGGAEGGVEGGTEGGVEGGTEGGVEGALPRIRLAARALLDPATPEDQVLRRHMIGAVLSTLLWDAGVQRALWRRVIGAARESGALWQLVIALYCAATLEVQLGEPAAARALLAESDQIRAAIGATDELWAVQRHPELLAWRSGPEDRDPAPELGAALAAAGSLGAGSIQSMIRIGLVVFTLGRGDYPRARDVAREVFETDSLGLHSRVLPDLVEAAIRSGDRVLAERALSALTGPATAAGTDWALGLLARSRALLAPPAGAEVLYRQAITLLAGTPARADVARAHLLHGEWLRRQRRRRDARAELRTALAGFEAIGATGFAVRAAQELDATGQSAGRRAAGSRTAGVPAGLTPQETAIARLAAAGATNGEIAEQLFLSANTVDHHLRKVFRKLAVTSRRQLPR